MVIRYIYIYIYIYIYDIYIYIYIYRFNYMCISWPKIGGRQLGHTVCNIQFLVVGYLKLILDMKGKQQLYLLILFIIHWANHSKILQRGEGRREERWKEHWAVCTILQICKQYSSSFSIMWRLMAPFTQWNS